MSLEKLNSFSLERGVQPVGLLGNIRFFEVLNSDSACFCCYNMLLFVSLLEVSFGMISYKDQREFFLVKLQNPQPQF